MALDDFHNKIIQLGDYVDSYPQQLLCDFGELISGNQSKRIHHGYRWKENRIAILRVNPEIFGRLLLHNASYKVTSGLPADARCIRVDTDILSGDIICLIESEEYEPVDEGSIAPHLSPSIIEIERID